MGIAVIGMDRSGSSLAMRTLAAVGVDIGDDAGHVPPHAEDNPHGYQELRALVDLNGRLLDLIDADPLDTELGSGIDWNEPRFDELRKQARALVDTSFAGEPWAIKEPRMSLVVPFWRSVLPDMKFVICLREPSAVIRSQERRESNYEDRERLLRKWLRYTVASLRSTEGAERLIVDYDDAVSRPGATAARYAHLAGLERPSAEVDAAADSLVDPNLLARQSDAESIDPPPEIAAAYLLIKSAGDERELAAATIVAAELETALIERTGAKWRHAATVGMYESSLSWRATKPLRAISTALRR